MTKTNRSSFSHLRSWLEEKKALEAKLIAAAAIADWGQIVANGGPPCFDLESGRFCLRAKRWPGHSIYHEYVPLDSLLATRGPSLPFINNTLERLDRVEECEKCGGLGKHTALGVMSIPPIIMDCSECSADRASLERLAHVAESW